MDNFREVSYGVVKKGLLFRGKALINLSESDVDLIVNQNSIKTIIDLRAPDEREQAMDQQLPGINNISIPLFNSNKTEAKAVNVMGMNLPDMSAIYRELVLEDKKDAWAKIFSVLLENKGHGIMFHCTSGKDRTGVTMAIILSSLGVNKDIIYSDYLLTNEYNDPSFVAFAKTLPEELGKAFLDHFSAKKEYLDAVFDEINNRYESLNNFYQKCCDINDDKIATLKKMYLL